MNKIYLGGGCFWGLEELFSNLEGVTKTRVGYCGGQNKNPTYQNHPGHAETVEIVYDSKIISCADILDYFFRIHDPTTINRQGNDLGSSYRSVIFYRDLKDFQVAKSIIEKIDNTHFWKDKIVTKLEKFDTFYPAEEYHQKYLKKHPGGYTCHFIRSVHKLI